MLPMIMAATAFAILIMVVPMVMMMIMRVMVPVLGMAMVRHRSIRMLHPAIWKMGVVVTVAVNGQCLGRRDA